MANITITGFKGAVPKFSAKLLENSSAQVAQNCTIENGQIKPLKDVVLESQLSDFYVVTNSTATCVAATPYTIGDIVRYGTKGINYICIKDNPLVSAVSILPDDATGNAYWDEILVYVTATLDAAGDPVSPAEVQQITDITCSTVAQTGVADYIIMTFGDSNQTDIQVYFWFKVTDAGTPPTDPGLVTAALLGMRGIQIDVVVADNTGTLIATAFESALAAYTSSTITGTNVTITGANTIADSGSGFSAAGFEVGDTVRISGATNVANNNQIHKLSGVADALLTTDSSSTMVIESGASITVASDFDGLFSDVSRDTAVVTTTHRYPGAVTLATEACTHASWAIADDTTGVDPTWLICGPNGIETIYKHDGVWLQWAADVDVVRSNVPDNDFRIYFTGDGYPKQTNKTIAQVGASINFPSTVYRLGIPAPATALTETVNTGGGSLDTNMATSYVYTYVTAFGEESAPSPPSDQSIIAIGDDVTLTGFVPPVGGGISLSDVTIRIYRVSVGDTLAEYLFVNHLTDNLTLATAISSGYTDNINASALGESLSTEDYDAPADDMLGITEYGHGVYAGFVGNSIAFSEPFYPYAYPIEYRVNVVDNIVGLSSMGGALVVCTDRVPSIIQGTHPANMVETRLPYNRPCTAKKSIVSNKYGVTYSSPDGLFMIDNNTTGIILTDGVYTREQWQAFDLTSIIGVFFDDKYYGFFKDTSTGFLLDYQNPEYITTFDISNYTVQDAKVDGTYIYITVTNLTDDVQYVYKFDADTANMTYTYTTKVFQEYNYTNFSAARVIGDFNSGDLSMKLYTDGILQHTEVITGLDDIFRLPAGFRGKEFYITLTGTAVIDTVQIAQTVRELKLQSA